MATKEAALKALDELEGLIEYLTRIDYVPLETREDVKKKLIDIYNRSDITLEVIRNALLEEC